ncbi:3-hydroxybutyryl-CoA dehydrogenase [Candidatus Woesearchaeota archaeon CG10_big_fil_rev_8_21_14_0_10_44_13]|nr:MAG: 3-hydroxybutyryl-CoA dehydrogenase [Candidatus Woesearchaeota archaeon CG10_big_fil_rev_8_21_14_0_10_44_13]
MVFVCKKCGKVYYYDVKRCIFCRSEVSEKKDSKLKVKAFTEVLVPSSDHKQVPYFDVLVEDDQGNLGIIKSGVRYDVGHTLEPAGKGKDKGSLHGLKMGIVGTGVTGLGIAEVALMHGMEVRLISRTEDRLKKAGEEISRFMAKFMAEKDKNEAMGRYRPSARIEDLGDVDLVIESVVEDKKTKDEYFRKLDKICKKNAVIATNTSSLSVDELGENLKDPSRFLGIHFFNPVPRMALVEVVKGKNTSEKTLNFAVEFAETLGKSPVITKDSPCFIVNRIMVPYLNEAAHIYGEGVASKEDIDKAVKLGLNHPMGPLALMDLIGLDVVLEIMNNIRNKTNDRKYLPAGIMVKMVKEGKLGRKSGQGFFKYS